MEPDVFIAVFTRATIIHYSEPDDPFNLTSFVEIRFNVISILRLLFRSNFHPWRFMNNLFIRFPCLFRACYIPRPSHPHIFGFPHLLHACCISHSSHSPWFERSQSTTLCGSLQTPLASYLKSRHAPRLPQALEPESVTFHIPHSLQACDRKAGCWNTELSVFGLHIPGFVPHGLISEVLAWESQNKSSFEAVRDSWFSR
jgi:hypothetical protein